LDTLSYKTISANKQTVEHKWFVVDAEGQPLGRISSLIASTLRGKHKPSYTPHVDCGDNVIVINAEKVKLTGKKMTNKVYLTYSGYPGGQKKQTPREMLAKHPERLVETAVKGMLPKNKLGRAMFKKLFIYAGTEHPHTAQKPESLK
jgi:large subunit ribosomal protein L13